MSGVSGYGYYLSTNLVIKKKKFHSLCEMAMRPILR
jgi:hypothetical protein